MTTTVAGLLGGINLFDPTHVAATVALLTAFLLGMVHGVTPDEHTWPITFSYSVGSYSSRGGWRAGVRFSAAFTLQRAIGAELAYFALTAVDSALRWDYGIYVVVGAVMVLSGLAILGRGPAWWRWRPRRGGAGGGGEAGPAGGRAVGGRRAPHPLLPFLHGFIAGWGVGAFAIIVYTVLVPTMPSAWVGWVPGALFGLGTMVTQAVVGTAFGAWMARRRLPDSVRADVARTVSGRTLAGGGAAFLVAGLIGVLWPHVLDGLAIGTGIRVHNLDHIDLGFFLAVPVVFGFAAQAFWSSTRRLLSGAGVDGGGVVAEG
ncbi:MAG: hypothetical protein ACRD0L_10820 [Acidimicrobiales bacterium]